MTKMKKFIDGLMAQMTLEEKLGQLNLLTSGGGTLTGSSINTGVDAKIAEGIVGSVFGTTWRFESVLHVQKVAVEKSRLKIPLIVAADFIHGHINPVFPTPLASAASFNMDMIGGIADTIKLQATSNGMTQNYSPMVDLTWDPRWGRVVEGGGESAILGSHIAETMVKAYQSGNYPMIATVKHLAAYGAPEGGREYAGASMDWRTLHNFYLKPYEAAVKAGAWSCMVSFNKTNGQPSHSDPELIKGLLCKKWKFQGFTVADFEGNKELQAHGMGDTLEDVSIKALEAGVHMDMVSEGYIKLEPAIQAGKTDVANIDDACRRILEVKWRLGLFQDPYKYLNPERKTAIEARLPEFIKQAREAAAESCVLLRNDPVKGEPLLPLKKDQVFALIGPHAHDEWNAIGTWAPASDGVKAISLLKGMRNVLGDEAKILYAKGANIVDDPVMARRLNEFSRAAIFKNVVIDPRPPGQMIEEALDIVSRADIAIIAIGEAKEHVGESSSRADITVPECQMKLVEAVAKTGKPFVVVLTNGRPLDLTRLSEIAPAILSNGFLGSESGNALADLLFGDKAPSGRVVMSYPRSVGQGSMHHTIDTGGRPRVEPDTWQKFKYGYIDEKTTPLYPFGWGLTYTTFKYSQLDVDKVNPYGDDDTVTVSIKVTNTGKREGKEVVQLYLSDPVASTGRPDREMIDYKKIALKPGESKHVVFKVNTEQLKFSIARSLTDTRKIWESGNFIFHVGPNAEDTQSAKVFWAKPAVAKTFNHG